MNALVEPSLEIARNLLREQYPDRDFDDLSFVNAGWDNAMFLLDGSLVVRLPRRAEAVETVHNEQMVLPLLSQLLVDTPPTIATPQLVHAGVPTSYFGYPWSLLTWLPGTSLFENPIEDSSALVNPLASFLATLHQPAPKRAPTNPHRGGALDTRTKSSMHNLRSLGDKIQDGTFTETEIERTWNYLLQTAPWNGPEVWLHGDIHPGNLLSGNGLLSAVIDWGDVCSGDPATDLAVAWMLFDKPNRARFRQALEQAGHPVDEATWSRARAWALSLGLAHLSGSNDTNHTELGHLVIDRVLD